MVSLLFPTLWKANQWPSTGSVMQMIQKKERLVAGIELCIDYYITINYIPSHTPKYIPSQVVVNNPDIISFPQDLVLTLNTHLSFSISSSHFRPSNKPWNKLCLSFVMKNMTTLLILWPDAFRPLVWIWFPRWKMKYGMKNHFSI